MLQLLLPVILGSIAFFLIACIIALWERMKMYKKTASEYANEILQLGAKMRKLERETVSTDFYRKAKNDFKMDLEAAISDCDRLAKDLSAQLKKHQEVMYSKNVLIEKMDSKMESQRKKFISTLKGVAEVVGAASFATSELEKVVNAKNQKACKMLSDVLHDASGKIASAAKEILEGKETVC